LRQIHEKKAVHDTENDRIFLDFLKEVTINQQIFNAATRRQKGMFYSSPDFQHLLQFIDNFSGNGIEPNIKRAVLNGRDCIVCRDSDDNMTPDDIFNNVVNSPLGDKLVSIYKSNKYPFLNDDIKLYFDDDRLNDNKTSGDSKADEKEEDVKETDISFESAKESGNDTEDTTGAMQEETSDDETVGSIGAKSTGEMSLDSEYAQRDDESENRERSEGEPEDSGDDEVGTITDSAPREEPEEPRTMRPIITADGSENTRGRSRPSSKTPVKSNTPRPGFGLRTRSQSTNNISELRRSPRNIGRPKSTTPFFGGKRKTNKMRRKQTPKRSMRRKPKNTRSSRKRTHRKTNTNKNTHTRRRR